MKGSLFSIISVLSASAVGIFAQDIEKRGFPGSATYFLDGLGACGQVNGPGDFIVALNTAQYGSGSPGPQCFKFITITEPATGKTARAQIMDECPTCGWGSLDFSQGLFEHFHDTGVGEFPITWVFEGASEPEPPKTTAQAPKPKPTPTPTPTHVYVPPTPTPTPEPEPTPTPTPKKSTKAQPTTTKEAESTWVAPSSSAKPSTSKAPWSVKPEPTTSAQASTSVAPSSASATPSASASTVPVASGDNFGALNGIVVAFGQLIGAAAGI